MTEPLKIKKPILIESSEESIESEEDPVEEEEASIILSPEEVEEVEEEPLEKDEESEYVSSEVPDTSSTLTDEFNEENLQEEYEKLGNCKDENYYSKECNKFLLKKELIERENLSEHPKNYEYLYPNLNDTEFNIKIANKKEFNDTKYDGTIHDSIKEQADILAKADYELQPQQVFVKNFMSFQTYIKNIEEKITRQR